MYIYMEIRETFWKLLIMHVVVANLKADILFSQFFFILKIQYNVYIECMCYETNILLKILFYRLVNSQLLEIIKENLKFILALYLRVIFCLLLLDTVP